MWDGQSEYDLVRSERERTLGKARQVLDVHVGLAIDLDDGRYSRMTRDRQIARSLRRLPEPRYRCDQKSSHRNHSEMGGLPQRVVYRFRRDRRLGKCEVKHGHSPEDRILSWIGLWRGDRRAGVRFIFRAFSMDEGTISW